MNKGWIIAGMVFLIIGLAFTPTLFFSYNLNTGIGVRAYGDNGLILYIYGNNKTLASEWKDYLENNDYEVELLPVDGLLNAYYKRYNLIIVGADTYGMWNSNDVERIKLSRVPVVGIGRGGLQIFTIIGLDIKSGNCMTITNANNMNITKRFSIYSEPNFISNIPGTLKPYTTSDSIRAVYKMDLNKNTSVIYAYDNNFTLHATIVQQDLYLYWAYELSPIWLTSDGDALLENILYHMMVNFVVVPEALKAVTMDGKVSYSLEWVDGRNISFSGGNYLLMKEDQKYLYFYMHLDNSTTDGDYMYIWFEMTNNKTMGTDVGCFYVLLSEGWKSVKVRKKLFYTPPGSVTGWSGFEDPDGTNISAAWVLGTDHHTAEIRILKSYLNLSYGSRHYLGFGVKVVTTNTQRFPTYFDLSAAYTATTMISENNWYGHFESIMSKYRASSPAIDGQINYDEWYASSWHTTVNLAGQSCKIRAVHTNTTLYLGLAMTNTTGYDKMYIFIDADGNGGNAPQTDDIEIWGGESPSGFYLLENKGTGSDWNTSTTYSDSYAFSYYYGYLELEITIPYDKLNITTGIYKSIRIGFKFTYNSSSNYTDLPGSIAFDNPTTWNLRLYPMDIWETNRVDALDAPESLFNVNIDGSADYNTEWRDAYYYSGGLSNGKAISIAIKNNGTHLLIATWYFSPNATDYTYIEFYFDAHYDHTGAPDTDDYCFRVAYNGSMKEFVGSGSEWIMHSTTSGWTAATQNISYIWNVEIAIEYSKLGITPGSDTDLGFMIFVSDYGKHHEYWPAALNSLNLSKYARITSSNNWGSPTIPEIDVSYVLLLFALSLILAYNYRRFFKS